MRHRQSGAVRRSHAKVSRATRQATPHTLRLLLVPTPTPTSARLPAGKMRVVRIVVRFLPSANQRLEKSQPAAPTGGVAAPRVCSTYVVPAQGSPSTQPARSLKPTAPLCRGLPQPAGKHASCLQPSLSRLPRLPRLPTLACLCTAGQVTVQLLGAGIRVRGVQPGLSGRRLVLPAHHQGATQAGTGAASWLTARHMRHGCRP